MLNGGYKIINLRGFALSAVATVIEGIYEAIEGNYGKAIMLSGLTIGGVEKPDAFVTANVDSGNFVIDVYGQKLTITANDEVTVTDIFIDNNIYAHLEEGDYTTVILNDYTVGELYELIKKGGAPHLIITTSGESRGVYTLVKNNKIGESGKIMFYALDGNDTALVCTFVIFTDFDSNEGSSIQLNVELKEA